MKCPYCGSDMPAGYLHNGRQPLQWIPQDKNPSPMAYDTTPDGRTLNNQFTWFKKGGGYNAKAWLCDRCGIVIAPTEFNQTL